MRNVSNVSPALLTAHDIESWDELSDLEAMALAQDPAWWLREDQYPPRGEWRQLGFICGRSMGKTYACAAIVTELVNTGQAKSIGLSAQDLDNAYALNVESLLAAAPVWNRARLFRDRIEWANGSKAYVFTPESPDAPRGYNLDCAWLTEVAAYSDRDGVLLYDNIMSAMRDAGGAEHILWDTTPRGSSALLRSLIQLNEQDPILFPIVRGTTYQNPWLSKAFLRHQAIQYGPSTRKYKEEILAQVFDGAEGALWQRAWIDDHRVQHAPQLVQVALGYDPSASDHKGADAAGIVIAGRDDRGHLYVIADASGKHSVASVGHVLIDNYLRYRASGVVSERNRGVGFVLELIRSVARERGMRVNAVPLTEPFPTRHDPQVINVKEVTSRGKKLERAEPIVSLYSQGLVHHVGDYSELEREQLTYDGYGDSPNAFDACNMVINELANLKTGRQPKTPYERKRELNFYDQARHEFRKAQAAKESRDVLGGGGSDWDKLEQIRKDYHSSGPRAWTVPGRSNKSII